MAGGRIAAWMATAVALSASGVASERDWSRATEAERLSAVREALREVPLIDGHNDLPWQLRQRFDNQLERVDLREDQSQLDPPLHTDIPRLRKGMVGGQFWSVYIPSPENGNNPGDTMSVIRQIDVTRRMIDAYDEFELALTADDVERAHRSGRIASMLGIEGGHAIENQMAVLRAVHELGVRYMTLTHWAHVSWADAATQPPLHGGLTPFGKEVVREMNRLGMLVDLSHVSAETMHDALDVAEAPVIFSHSSARAVADHARNVPDDVLQRVKENGGLVMVTFVPSYLSQDLISHLEARRTERERLAERHEQNEEAVRRGVLGWLEENQPPVATVESIVDHIDHIVATIGVDYVGLGGDYDGIRQTPEGMEDVSTYPTLMAELLARGYSVEDVKKIAGLNALRVMREAERVASRLQRERGPSEALIEDLDKPITWPGEPGGSE